MTNKSNYKKSGYFNFDVLNPSKNETKKEIDIKVLENAKSVKNFKISTDKYRKTMMKIRTVKYEIKD